MCGIVGFISLDSSNSFKTNLKNALHSLEKRGPDDSGIFLNKNIGLGHTRLSIIDTSQAGHQPISDPSGRYTLIFNGEIYNHADLRKALSGYSFKSTSDTEVLLYLLIKEGTDCLKKLNGFFALAFYDSQTDTLIIARDQMGIKPLHYFLNDDFFVFGSEVKALLNFPIPRNINQEALYWYLKLSYLPGHLSMIQGMRKLEPGHFVVVKDLNLHKSKFCVDTTESDVPIRYTTAKSDLVNLLDRSVKRRLMSDVPLGSFLSGGTDSSAIVSLASKYTDRLSTFSIGYKDHPFFDETYYAEIVARKFDTQHTTISLTNNDLLNDISEIVDYIDEPFADSSAIPTYILSKHVRKSVKVALSGDGADELFGGYYKHLALAKTLRSSFPNTILKNLNPILSKLPQSRSGKWSNLIRRLDKYGKALKMNKDQRYWFLSSLTNDPSNFLVNTVNQNSVTSFKSQFLSKTSDLNDYLNADLNLLLPGDMLTKVDLMSMANGLEVRVPFLDVEVVRFAQRLPTQYKIRGNQRKRILQDAFKEILPKEIYNRPKKGFEVPLLHWMRNELLSELDEVLFNHDFLQSQAIFNHVQVLTLRQKMFSSNPGDVHGIIWCLYIFQKWYKRLILA